MNDLDMNAKNHDLSSQRRTKKSCYIVIKSMVFDVTRFIADHPGGESGALPVLGVHWRPQCNTGDAPTHKSEEYGGAI